MVGTKEYLYSYRIASFPQPLDRVHSLKEKENLIKHLNVDIIKKIEYFPYPDSSNAFNFKDYFKQYYPEIRISNEKLHDRLFKCELLILDHPGTTLNIAMAANIPVICIWPKDIWAMCDQAEPYFNLLKNAGILHYDGISAAEIINSISSDIISWWESELIQNARLSWKFNFAKTGKNWRRQWAKAIWEI